jgi:molybdopterin/thiamine biosynthesis adenylyltransferase/rhodanese-related sulfurtransferase
MLHNKPSYYQSHQKLPFIGIDGQVKLNAAKVLVIGAGGLGCPCLQYLVGAGIGTIGIADFDSISLSNLHRQLLFTVNDIGQLKTEVAAKRLAQHNPNIQLSTHQLLIDKDNVLALLSSYDVIVDATDNFEVRYLINDACVYLQKPLVYGAIHQTEGHVTVFNYKGAATLRCLFPENANNITIPSCADIGAYNITTGVIGMMMANEVVKVVLDNEHVLTNQLYCIDVLTGKSRTIKYKLVAESLVKSKKQFASKTTSIAIDAAEVYKLMNSDTSIQLVDIRESYEQDEIIANSIHIPITDLSEQLALLPKQQTIVLYCATGRRSLQAATLFRMQGFENMYSLQGGIGYFTRQYGNTCQVLKT